MTEPQAGPVAAINRVLSEIIDVIQDVKQAHRNVPEAQTLHRELDLVFDDLRAWAQLLLDQDDAHGGSPLVDMPTVAGRPIANLWRTTPTIDDARRVVAEHLERLGRLVAATAVPPGDEGMRDALAQIERGISAHLAALS